MIKRICFLFLFLCTVFALFSQDAADRRRDRSAIPQPSADADIYSFTINNNTGYSISDVLVSRRADGDTGENAVIDITHRGRRIIIRLNHPLDDNYLYDIILIDRDGDRYAKLGVRLAANDTVTIEMTDMVF